MKIKQKNYQPQIINIIGKFFVECDKNKKTYSLTLIKDYTNWLFKKY